MPPTSPSTASICAPKHGRCKSSRYATQGFTLIELMIVVVIISILAAIAYPSYTEYVRRSILAEASGTLTSAKMAMDQFYMTKRSFATATAAGGPCPTAPQVGKSFTFTCTLNGGLNYTLALAGNAGSRVAGFTYTIDQAGTKAMVVTAGGGWQSSYACWVFRKGDACT